MHEGLAHHLHCTAADIGRYVILTGDPGRVEGFSKLLDQPRHVATNREYVIYTGTLKGEAVTVCSTGIGGASAAIAMEELVQCGSDTFIRVGTCGGIDPALLPGDLIIATAAIRKDGTGREYVPVEYPAVSNFDVTLALRDAAQAQGRQHHLGVVECKDSFYGQHDPDSMPCGDELKEKWKAWKMAGALGSEMESATLFLVAQVRRVRASSVLLLCRNREREDETGDTTVVRDISGAVATAVEAIERMIEADRA